MYNKVNSMETTTITRAKRLRDLYNSLQMDELTKDERLAVLETVRNAVKVRTTGLA